ncbi:MAG: deoxyhypusine synthase family protein [candidate division KSB1 bacterium]|nr:deoxyhypusine synthase family protein [candidate division KSB1 bacterium]
MPEHRSPTKRDILQAPTKPFEVKPGAPVSDILERMAGISFQGRQLAHAFRVWKEMLQDEVLILFGLAGAMVPAGMRKVLVYLIENRLIDCLVSTGANLFHDLHESLGFYHYLGHPDADDTLLRDLKIDRIYDTFADDLEFQQADAYIRDFARGLPQRPLTTREFFHLLGARLHQVAKEPGILTTAYQAGVPIYCPAIGDSSYGIALSSMDPRSSQVYFDVIADVRELAVLVSRAKKTGIIFVGGGTPKNFIQQAEVTAQILGWPAEGHHYAVQITTDVPQWGGLSGCTFSESHSWGKIHRTAPKIAVHVDATIALPLLATALSEQQELIRSRKIPELSFEPLDVPE